MPIEHVSMRLGTSRMSSEVSCFCRVSPLTLVSRIILPEPKSSAEAYTANRRCRVTQLEIAVRLNGIYQWTKGAARLADEELLVVPLSVPGGDLERVIDPSRSTGASLTSLRMQAPTRGPIRSPWGCQCHLSQQ